MRYIKRRFYNNLFIDEILNLIIYYNLATALKPVRKNKDTKFVNFLEIKRYIRAYHTLNTFAEQKRSCIIKPFMPFSYIKWSRMMIILVNQITCFSLHKYQFNRKVSPRKNNIQHSTTFFLINEVHYADCLLEGKGNTQFHAEILVRKLRKLNLDITFYQLLRVLLHVISSSNMLVQNLNLNKKYIQIKYLNILFTEIDSFLYSTLKKMVPKLYFYKHVLKSKIEFQKWSTNSFKTIFKLEFFFDYFVFKNQNTYSLSYSRFFNDFIFCLDSPDRRNLTLFYQRFQRFYERRLSCLNFTCSIYTSKVIQWESRFIYPLNSFFHCKALCYLHAQQYLFRIPFQYTLNIGLLRDLINSLYLYNLCTIKGYPISKSEWVRWHDIQIFNYFQILLNYFENLYSGVLNEFTIMYYIFYLLRYSYSKTLAFKHKRSLRFILTKPNTWKLLKLHFFLKNQQKICATIHFYY
jgi:hypothetical protein